MYAIFKCISNATGFRFLGNDDPTTFFATRDRQRVAYEILAQTVYGKRKRAEVGIDRLVEEGVFAAAFPLHDVSIICIINGIP